MDLHGFTNQLMDLHIGNIVVNYDCGGDGLDEENLIHETLSYHAWARGAVGPTVDQRARSLSLVQPLH